MKFAEHGRPNIKMFQATQINLGDLPHFLGDMDDLGDGMQEEILKEDFTNDALLSLDDYRKRNLAKILAIERVEF